VFTGVKVKLCVALPPLGREGIKQVILTELLPTKLNLQTAPLFPVGSGDIGAPLFVESVIVNFASVTVEPDPLLCAVAVRVVGVFTTLHVGHKGKTVTSRSPMVAAMLAAGGTVVVVVVVVGGTVQVVVVVVVVVGGTVVVVVVVVGGTVGPA